MNKYIKRLIIIFSCTQLFLTLAWSQQRSCGMLNYTQELRNTPAQKDAHLLRVQQFENRSDRRLRESSVPCTTPTRLPIAIHFQGINNPNVSCLLELAKQQVAILNADFQGKNADISLWQKNAVSFPGLNNGNTCVQFVLANQNHPLGYNLKDGDPSVTINSTTGDYLPNWKGYINIFVRNIVDLGYAPLGGNGDGDGIVVDDNAFGTFSCGQVKPNIPYNLGRTLVHEMGHYLYLNHIWSNENDKGGCDIDDGVEDTPVADEANYGCPSLKFSCDALNLQMNYMDYVNDACMYMFTQGQSERMENWIASNLGSVTNKSALVYTDFTCLDNDKDGYCAEDDCNDEDSTVPAASGTACDDNNPNTYNDIIQLDGCTCLGTVDLCSTLGGDKDGDGICDDLDCNPDDACYPKEFGTACNDGNSATTDDAIQADGCTCAGRLTVGNATTVRAKLLLEGFYDPIYQRLSTQISEQNLLPLKQPYNVAPWNYGGNESVTKFPTDVVDWILIMARDANDKVLAQSAGFITQSGSLIDINGNPGISLNNALGNHISIHQRNHLAVVSAAPYTKSIDFTSSSSAVKGNQQLTNKYGLFLLYAGDFDGNGLINNLDYNKWALKKSLLNQYFFVDGDGNGIINNRDYNLWVNNSAKIGYSPLRY